MASGLWFLLLAALLALALRRWYDPVPPRCWLIWGTVLAILLGPALFGGGVLLPLGNVVRLPPYVGVWEGDGRPPGNQLQGDLVVQIVPWMVQVREAFARGEWPLWNHLVGAGEPLLANPQSQALQPLVWLTMPLPVPAAVDAIAALRILIPLVFFYLFLRRQGLSEASGLWGSLAFSLAGYLQGWLGWPLAGSATFLPLLLYAVAMVDERGARRDLALGSIAGAAVLLVGHPETELYVFALAGLFALARLRARPAGRRLPLLAAWAVAGAIAFGLAAPVLLPSFRYLPQGLRVAQLEERRERLDASEPFAELRSPEARAGVRRGLAQRLVPLAAPNAFGNNRFGRYWGEQNVINDSAGFTGTAALLGCLLAFAPLGAGRRFPQERMVKAVAIVCLIVLAQPPGLAHLFNALPVLRESASLHSRVSLAFNFAVAYLAACTWERWRRGEVRRGAAVLLAVLLAALVAWGYLAHPAPNNPQLLAGLRMGSLAVHLTVLASTVLLLLLVQTRMAWAMTLLIAGELLFVFKPQNPAVPARLFFPETPPIAFLKERLRPGDRTAALGNAFRPNYPSVHGLADPRSSNPMKPAAYYDLLRPINAAATAATDVFDRPEDPLYSLLGVRFVITAPRTFLPKPLRLSFRRNGTWIWRRPGALPRLFLPAATEVCTDCLGGVTDFASRTVLREGKSWAAADPAGSSLEITGLRPAWIRARASLTEERLLTGSVYQDGGWRVLVDGERRPATLANGPFVAAWLPAGAGAVDLLYRPPGFLPGMALAALALAGAALAFVPPPTRSTARSRR
jgi:hypothetical protein